jgi:hypothetical protein
LPCCPGAARKDSEVKASNFAQKNSSRNKALNGAPEEIRTPDPQIRSLVLKGAMKAGVEQAKEQ